MSTGAGARSQWWERAKDRGTCLYGDWGSGPKILQRGQCWLVESIQIHLWTLSAS